METKKLSELCLSITDCPHSTPKWTTTGKLVIRNQNIKNGKIDLSNPSYTDEQNYNLRCKRAKPIAGDLIITREAPMGEVCIVPQNLECCLGQRMVLLKVNEDLCSNLFLLYSLMSRPVQHQIRWSEGTGTTVSNLRIPHLENLDIPYIPLSQQYVIADALSSLDNKVELNNRINKNLETQAQAIFKSWFVDFEPFQGGEFVDSELGKIPKGWRAGTLNDLVESTLGGDWGKEVPSGNYTKEVYCIRGADIPEINKGNKGKMPARYILPKNFANKQLCNNDIVIEISGGSPTQSTGRATLITQFLLERYDKDMVCTNFCKAIKPLTKYSYFIYYLWQYLYNKGVMFSYENGTTGIKNFDINGFLSEETVVIPPCEIAEQFFNVIMPYVKLTYSYGQQNQTLSTLRDTLLPKLMSGEIQIPQEV